MGKFPPMEQSIKAGLKIKKKKKECEGGSTTFESPEWHEGGCMCLVVVHKTPSRPCVTSFITNDNSNDVCIVQQNLV
jgi:hypothetical protein